MQVVFSTGSHCPIGVDGSLGNNLGGSRGVNDGADIVGATAFDILLKESGVCLLMLFPQL